MNTIAGAWLSCQHAHTKNGYCLHCLRKVAKPVRYWNVSFVHGSGEQVGPTWEIKSKICPTRWAQQHVGDAGPDCVYLIAEQRGK